MTVDDRFTADPGESGDEEPEGTMSEIITGPVTDWATDFSHLEPEWAADPYPIQDDLRQRCPIAHTDRFGGGWLPTRAADVAAAARAHQDGGDPRGGGHSGAVPCAYRRDGAARRR